MGLFIDLLTTLYGGNIILVEGVSENISEVQNHIKGLLFSRESVKLLKHQITNKWLKELVEAFNDNYRGEELEFSPENTVVEHLADIKVEFDSTKSKGDAVDAFDAMGLIAMKAMKRGYVELNGE